MTLVAALPAEPLSEQGLVAVNDNREPSAHELHMAQLLGELRGELTGIKTILDDIRGDVDSNTQSHRKLHEKLSLVDSRLQTVEGTVAVLGGVVAKQTTRVDKIEPLARVLITIATGLCVVGGALWYVVLNFGATIVSWINAVLARMT